MPQTCELLIRGGRVVDAASGLDAIADVAVAGSQVAAVGGELPHQARETIDATGLYVLPGLIDMQVHLVSAGPHNPSHRMLARAGVTTALDLAGPIGPLLEQAGRFGSGLTIACIDRMVAGRTIAAQDASYAQAAAAIEDALAAGAIGVKLHADNPLTPGGAAAVIAAANERRAYVAMHCGTTATGSDLTGLREAVALAAGRRLQIAHVNSYCRGAVDDPLAEAQEAIALLTGAPQLFSEAYMAAINGNWAGCSGGAPEVPRVRAWLAQAGYAPTEAGMRQAILDEFALIPVAGEEQVALLTGAAGVAAWEAAGTKTGLSLPINPPLPRLTLALARDTAGRFAIDAFTTDGGIVPRNDVLAMGLGLVRLGLLSRRDFVLKAAWTPARVLGLAAKGRIGPGADADIVLADPLSGQAHATIAGGRVVMRGGRIFGAGTRVLTTEAGVGAVARAGCEPIVIDLTKSGFYTGDGLKA